jgi:hypothetical protein
MRGVMKRIVLAAAMLLLAARAMASNGNIVLGFGGASVPGLCSAAIPCECSARLHVWAIFQGQSAGGITGVEYRIEVGRDNRPDPGWMFVETFDPGRRACITVRRERGGTCV